MENRTGTQSGPLSCSSVLAGSRCLYAAAMGGAIYGKHGQGEWERISAPDEPHAVVNRMVMAGETLYACTSRGLMVYDGAEWDQEELELPCYQFRASAGCLYACTSQGLWCSHGASWGAAAKNDRKVYDLLNVPQYLILGCESGIALYDRMSAEWMEFDLGTGVTSLAVYYGQLVGASENGEMVVGNRKGGFDRYRYGGFFLFSVVVKGGRLLACTDRGLYRISWLGGCLTMMAVSSRVPVTDVDIRDGIIYLATLYDGIQQVEELPGGKA